MGAKSIIAGFASVICGGVLLMPLLVQPNPVSAASLARPLRKAIAGVLPYEDCALGASADTRGTWGDRVAMAPDDRRERPCPREPVRLAQGAGAVTR